MTATKELGNALKRGRAALDRERVTDACDHWLNAWESVKQLAATEMSSVEQFDDFHPTLPESIYNWCQEFLDHLWNAALDDPKYQPHRLRFADEILSRFPATDPDLIQQFLSAKAESLLELGRNSEAEQLLDDLVNRFPNDGQAHLARSDQYWPFGPKGVPKNHARAEELILSALARPDLIHRDRVLDRLESLYEDWGQPGKSAGSSVPRRETRKDNNHERPDGTRDASVAAQDQTRSTKVGRNDPCPCGSGKKFKKCCLGKVGA